MKRAFPTSILGSAALFSGVALVMHILAGISLRLCLAATFALLVLLVTAVWTRARPEVRRRVLETARGGAQAGLIALLAYDTSKLVLSWLDPSPYNPFEVMAKFGVLLVGSRAPALAVWCAGLGFHALNGISFGVAFCFWFGSRGWLAGVAWGLFLELFQLTLYPGWLDIRAYREFAQISALSHVVYGTVLGSLCRREISHE